MLTELRGEKWFRPTRNFDQLSAKVMHGEQKNYPLMQATYKNRVGVARGDEYNLASRNEKDHKSDANTWCTALVRDVIGCRRNY